jgi:hypothetical protein
MTQDQIRQLNADFNYENYEQFYEKPRRKLEEKDDESISKSESDSQIKEKKESSTTINNYTGEEQTEVSLKDMVSKNNLLFQMESKIKLEPHEMKNYEQWLEDEVWSYFD